ncbi:MAG: recombinase zinc beta ribbon domain-containing protein [Coriobacteriia bacterium]
MELFERVQEAFSPNRTKNNAQKRSYALRDFLTCAECGAKITAGTHKGHVYYRCTHGKGACSQRSYIREGSLTAEVASLLARIEIDSEVVAALVEAAERAASQGDTRASARGDLDAAVRANRARSSALLDRLLDGVIDNAAYRTKADELETELRTLELRIAELDQETLRPSAQVEALARLAQGARIDFERGDLELKRRVLAGVLCNATVEEGHICVRYSKS